MKLRAHAATWRVEARIPRQGAYAVGGVALRGGGHETRLAVAAFTGAGRVVVATARGYSTISFNIFSDLIMVFFILVF